MDKQEYEKWVEEHVGPIFKQHGDGAITLTEAAIKVCDLVVDGPEPPQDVLNYTQAAPFDRKEIEARLERAKTAPGDNSAEIAELEGMLGIFKAA